MKIKKIQEKLVLVRVQQPKEQDDSGIFIQEEWQTLDPVGVVEMIGDDVHACAVGDKVWFERYTATQHPTDKELRMCREDSIMAVYED